MENKFETGRILIKTEIQGSPSCNQIGQGKKKKKASSQNLSWEGSVRRKSFTQVDPHHGE